MLYIHLQRSAHRPMDRIEHQPLRQAPGAKCVTLVQVVWLAGWQGCRPHPCCGARDEGGTPVGTYCDPTAVVRGNLAQLGDAAESRVE